MKELLPVTCKNKGNMNEFDEYSFTMRNHGLFFISVALVVAEDVKN